MDDVERAGIIDGIRAHLARRPEILFACLHGSFLRGGSWRDIDVAVWLDPRRVPRDEWPDYALDRSVTLSMTQKLSVDVRVLNGASLAFRYHALGGHAILVRDAELFHEVRARAWDDYLDFQPWARQFLREVLVNLDRLRDLAAHLRRAVRELRELGALSEAAFLADRRTVDSAKYRLIVAAEAALDICNHLVARKGGRSPADYADCMAVMAELGILDEDLAARLMRTARFRNLLVHMYAAVDDRRVYRVIRERLGDLEEYLQSIGRHLKADLG